MIPGDPKGVTRDKLDDVIGIAAELSDPGEEQVPLAEVQRVGAELGLAPEKVEEAVAELERRERQAAAEARAREATVAARRRVLWIAAGVGLAAALSALGILGLTALSGQASLRAALEDARRQEAQVQAILARQAEVEALFAGRDPSVRADDELTGSINRVAVERKRYDEAAAVYNAEAGAFPGSLWARLFGLPAELPPSSAITR
jgi:hypothetical protein